MALTIGGVQKRIGLALSGGGFRAAAFHLGVMRKLAALGILDHVDLLTCVSGGSIAGGAVARHWSDAGKLDVLDQYLRTRSIAASSVIGGVLDPQPPVVRRPGELAAEECDLLLEFLRPEPAAPGLLALRRSRPASTCRLPASCRRHVHCITSWCR